MSGGHRGAASALPHQREMCAGSRPPPSLPSWAGMALLTVRWGGSLPQTGRAGGQAAPGALFSGASPHPWAFPGHGPGGCGEPTRGPRGARETAESAAAGKSQVKGWRRPAVGRCAFPHEEPLVLTPQESELSKKRKKCESLEQEARKKQRRCEELVSSPGSPQGQPGGGLPLSSALTPPILRGSPALPGTGSRWGEEGLVWEGQVLCVGRGGVWVLGPLPRAPLVSQELQLREAQNENARLVEENSRLSGRATEKEQVATLCMCCGAWASAGALGPGHGAVFSTPCTGLECEGYCSPGQGAAGTRRTHLAPCPSPLSRWSGRMQS